MLKKALSMQLINIMLKAKTKAKTITQDCYGCPASWSGELFDGRKWRARYRWGWLRFTVDKESYKMSVFSKEKPEILENFQLGSEYDGSMETEQMMNYLKELIDFSDVKWEQD